MKRTVRLLAAPASALLLLSACSGAADEPAAADRTAVEESVDTETDVEDESGSWPIVEDEEGNIVDDPEDEPMDAGEGATDEAGNQTSFVFGDDEYEFDMNALLNGAYPSNGTYYLEGMTGVVALAEIGAEGPAAVEGLRDSVGEEPLTYIRFDVDNRQGTEEIFMLELNMYDADGNEYTFETITSTTNRWIETADYEYTDEQSAFADEIVDFDSAAVGQRTEQWLVGPGELPDEMTIVHAIAETFTDEFYPMPVR